MRRLFPLLLLLVSGWFFLIVSSFLILKLLFQLPTALEGVNLIVLSVLRVAAGVLMFALWLWVWRYQTCLYFVKAMRRRGLSLE